MWAMLSSRVDDVIGQKRHWPGVNEATCSDCSDGSMMSGVRGLVSSVTFGSVDRVVIAAVLVVAVAVVAPSMKFEEVKVG